MSMKMKIMAVREGAAIPTCATRGSAGMDLHACIASPLILPPASRAVVPTGIAIELPSAEYVALVCARSGLAVKHGINLSNSVGVIDSDYRGEISVGLINQSDTAYEIQPGERIAQLLVMPVVCPEIVVCDALGETERGVGGFGSTGRGEIE